MRSSSSAAATFPSTAISRNMKRQTRPFAVEIKGARKRAANNPFGRLSFSDSDAAPRGGQGDLAAMWASFGQIASAGANDHTGAPAGAASAALTVEPERRVLPDLREAASNEVAEAKKARRSKTVKPKRALKRLGQANEGSIQVKADEVEPVALVSATVPAIRSNPWRSRKGLPRGERWKQRRLPPICWK